jgi:APA family basic amino acid/polyamine antiporter
MPATAVAGSPVPAAAATEIAVGRWGAVLVSMGMGLSMLVTLNGTIMSGSRIPFAVARDRYFFKTLADVHPRFHTPSAAIVVQAVMAIILLLGGGAFKDFFFLAIFAEWLFYMIAASTIFVFRRRGPKAELPYKAWGYPVVPALFVAASAVLLYFSFMENKRNSAIGTLVIVAGIPVYLYFARQRKTA